MPHQAGNVACWRACEQDLNLYCHVANIPEDNEKVIYVANIKSQIKRIGTNRKATERNKAVKSEVKTAIRSTRDAVTAGDKKAAVASLALASKKIDKAASKGVLHKNQAANRKSSIAKQVAAL